ncbi:MAG: bifunctional pyr operon transcriptional regulator/uracil phosphoribosyltransferase PyrR [Betaproteobacteria bacterium]|nr:bifunctional pyr operon transcriptional regulator/uracil phosphoribosyltransferase PyrR [Betaproteobacteria bacterium]MBK9608341.1 bifunctional pyr operon transcriptional regulator/uracil phosphoribosyltransferase PyrR [Betaproteobacteria bacterium]
MRGTDNLPKAEDLLAALAVQMQGAIAFDARLVGIHSGGAWLAERLSAMLEGDHPFGTMDVSFYRDDYNTVGLKPKVRRTQLPFDVEGARLVLIDDVLYTGRSVRAALNELFDYGRPASVELAVLVDRGGRELPIEPTYCGERVTVADDRNVVLHRAGDGRLSLGLEPAGQP